MKQTTNLSVAGDKRSLLAVIAVLMALAISLTLFAGLGAQPAAAKEKASDYLSDRDIEKLAEASEEHGIEVEEFDIAQALASKNPDSLGFPNTKVGSASATQNVIVTADKKGCVEIPIIGVCVGDFPVKVDGAAISGQSFSKSFDSCSGAQLAQGATCSVGVRFQPASEGFHSGQLVFTPGKVNLVNLKPCFPIIGCFDLGTIDVSTRFTDGTSVQLSGRGVEATPPKVIGFSPTGKKVSPGANVTATFNEAMLASSINGSNFTLRKSGASTNVSAAVSYDAATHRATLNPNVRLKSGATYVATVTTGVRDANDNALATQKTWKFTIKPRR